jgi:hypothetical protein
LQSILLLLHEAHQVDPARFVSTVFLPWVRLRRTLQPNWLRVAREMARIGEIAEGSTEETEHQIALYRLIVSDLFDPYITILVVEFVEAHLRGRGDMVQMFRSYDSRARNAISHAGSHGYVLEGRTILFRNISRGQQPRCLIPDFNGAIFSYEWKEALWSRFYTGAPPRQRRSVERYSIVKRA